MKLNGTAIEFLGINEDKKGYLRYLYAISELPSRERVGDCELRLEQENGALRNIGNIGYAVDTEKRGRGHAKNACQMLLLEAKKLGLSPIFITCDEKNIASRHVCESLGGTLDSSFLTEGTKISRYIF